MGRLSNALKRSGLLELMVYNSYHRILSSAYQKAIRYFSSYTCPQEIDFEAEMSMTRKIINGGVNFQNLMTSFLLKTPRKIVHPYCRISAIDGEKLPTETPHATH